MENTNLEKAAVLIKAVRMAGCIQKTPGGMDMGNNMDLCADMTQVNSLSPSMAVWAGSVPVRSIAARRPFGLGFPAWP